MASGAPGQDAEDWASQASFSCRFEWGPDGAFRAANRGDVLVIVDVLRFSTAVASAVHAGAWVYPRMPDEERVTQKAPTLADIALPSLSPRAYSRPMDGARIVLSSLNGARCVLAGRGAPALFAGSLVNAHVTAVAVDALGSERDVTVIACGEVVSGSSDRRFAVEDLVGAGAIVAELPGVKSPEAQVAEAAFLGLRHQLGALLWESASGRELRWKGLGEDVLFAGKLDVLDCAARLHGDHFQSASVGDSVRIVG